jgi:opacity protein-like surface antigen
MEIMGSKLRATVSVSAIALGIALSSQAARAADPVEQVLAPDWYVSVFGGMSFSRAQAGYFASQYEIKLKDGFSVGAAIGRQLGNGFRAESEISYVQNSNKAYRADNGSFDPDMNGETAAVFMLGNLWKDFRFSDTIQPYVGAGLGTATLIADENDDHRWDDINIALAGQVGAGLRVGLTDHLALDVGYRLRAAIDATLNSAVDGDENAVLSYYSHTVQAGISYALGGDSQIMPSGGGDPADWYVSLFGGGVMTDTNWNYSNSSQYFIDHKNGFTVGGAIGTHLAPGLRAELERSYARSALDSYIDDSNDDNPAGGHMDQGFLLANLWKDFDAGMLTPYIGGGIGFGLAQFDNADLDGDVLSEDTGLGFAGQFGFGARMAVSDNLSVDLGYRFKSIVDALIVGGNDETDNAEVSTTNHVVQLGLNYGLGANGGEDNSGVPDTGYVSLFGGAVLPVETHGNLDGHDYVVDFKTGFTLGAAIGQNLTDTLRGEIEIAFQSYDVDEVNEQGNPTGTNGGDINSYFLMANLWRDIEIGGFRPYAGGGVGMGLMDVHVIDGSAHETESTELGLAAQVGSGIRFDISDNLTVDVGYRFKAVAALDTEGIDGGEGHNSSSYFNHSGQVGVSWKF